MDFPEAAMYRGSIGARLERGQGRMKVVAFVLALAGAARAAEPIPWDEAEKHIGETTTVEGRVLGVHCSQLSCLLAFDPTFNRFTAVVQASHFGIFPPDSLDDRFAGRKVLVHGKIVENDKKPEIVLQKAEDIELAPEERERAAAEAEKEKERVQVETLERVADVLERVEELTERLAEVQERLDLVLARMEERAAALEAAAAAAPPPPAAPTYGEPQPRPGYEALRTVKRGMSRADVERLVGEPQWIEESAGGWTTYYYGMGRSVSFNSRGRAEAVVGFPTP